MLWQLSSTHEAEANKRNVFGFVDSNSSSRSSGRLKFEDMASRLSKFEFRWQFDRTDRSYATKENELLCKTASGACMCVCMRACVCVLRVVWAPAHARARVYA